MIGQIALQHAAGPLSRPHPAESEPPPGIRKRVPSYGSAISAATGTRTALVSAVLAVSTTAFGFWFGFRFFFLSRGRGRFGDLTRFGFLFFRFGFLVFAGIDLV